MAYVCRTQRITKRFEQIAHLEHATLARLSAGQLDRLPRVDPQGLTDALFLVVQYLYEEAERLRTTNWRKAERLSQQAKKLTQLHNAAFLIPTQRSQLDGPTEAITGRKE